MPACLHVLVSVRVDGKSPAKQNTTLPLAEAASWENTDIILQGNRDDGLQQAIGLIDKWVQQPTMHVTPAAH